MLDTSDAYSESAAANSGAGSKTARRAFRILMLSPHQTVRGPLPKHTPILVEALRGLGCEITSLPWGRHRDADSLPRRVSSRLADTLRVRAVATGNAFDLLVVKTSHEWTSLLRDLPLLMAVRRHQPCTVIQFHGGHSGRLAERGWRLFKAVTWLLLRLSDGVLVLSTEEERAASGFYPRGQFHTVINPYAPSRQPPPNDKWSGPPSPVPTVLYVGRLMAEKGVFELLHAFATVRAHRPSRLVIAGDGPVREQLAELASRLGVAGDVRFVGHVSGEQLEMLYHDADLFALPTYWAEGFPTVLTEAMAAGLPLVTTCLRGMADHLQEGRQALFVEPRKPEQLAGAITELLDNAPLRARMGAAARAKVNDFAPEAAARRYLQALEEIVGASVRPR